jgi:hypothetical protein
MQKLLRHLAALTLCGVAATGSGGAELRRGDPEGHQFDRWTGARSYLGRTFEEIRAQENFEIGANMFGKTSMRKQATATSPEVTVMDDGRNKRSAASVSVFQANPSEDFMRKLLATLSAQWGAPSGKDLDAGVSWSSPAFTGMLKLERVSPTGPYVTLKLESR